MGASLSAVMPPQLKAGFADYLIDESGATMIEYSVICSGIVVVIAAVVNSLGARIAEIFQYVAGLF